MGTPPSSRPPSSSVPSGTRSCIWAATRARRAGCDSNRYLSKYSLLTWPDRSVNSPVRRQQASMSAASAGSAVMGPRLVGDLGRALRVRLERTEEMAEGDQPVVGVEELRAGGQRDDALLRTLDRLRSAVRVHRVRSQDPTGRERDHELV